MGLSAQNQAHAVLMPGKNFGAWRLRGPQGQSGWTEEEKNPLPPAVFRSPDCATSSLVAVHTFAIPAPRRY